MPDQMKNLLKSFDEVFNDDFLSEAGDHEIELRFNFMKELCAAHKIDYRQLMDELEFHCNSFIAEIADESRMRPGKKHNSSGHQQSRSAAP